MSKSDKPNARQWNDSFLKSVPLDPGEVCEWKKHFRFALREVIGYLEWQASRNKGRFVWASVAAIVRGTNQYSKRKPYSTPAVEKALAFLATKGIIARVRRTEQTDTMYNGKLRKQMLTGFVVAPHDMCAMETGGRCAFWYGCLTQPTGTKGWDKPGVTVIQLPDWEENLAARRAFLKDRNKE